MDEGQKREEFTHCWLEAEPSVSAYVFASISGFHDAEDVVQRIAQELARRFDEYDPNRLFIGWALWIAKSGVIDFYPAQDWRLLRHNCNSPDSFFVLSIQLPSFVFE